MNRFLRNINVVKAVKLSKMCVGNIEKRLFSKLRVFNSVKSSNVCGFIDVNELPEKSLKNRTENKNVNTRT